MATYRLIPFHRIILLVLIQHQSLVVLYHFLDRRLDKLVKTLQLLPHQTLVLEKGADHCPIVVLFEHVIVVVRRLLTFAAELWLLLLDAATASAE